MSEMPDELFDAFLGKVVATARQSIPDREKVRGLGDALRRLATAGWYMPDPRYRQMQPGAPYGSYLLHLDRTSGLSVVLDVFAAGQIAAIHNHGTWGAFACIRGMERSREYALRDGRPVEISSGLMRPGDVGLIQPPGTDYHQVECASEDPSMSLHVYGKDIGRAVRSRWDAASANFVAFSSDYTNDVVGLAPYRPDIIPA